MYNVYIICAPEYCPLSLLRSPTSAVRLAGHFHITSEENEAQRQLLSGMARKEPGLQTLS